jgi:hypothetical protein
VPRSDRLTIVCVLVNAVREFAIGQITFGGRGPVLFSSDQLLASAGGRKNVQALVSDALRVFSDESPLELARLVAARLQPHLERGREALRVVPMSDSAARSLAGFSGPLLHSDSLKLKDGELLLAILNGDGFEPCSFHGKYRRTAGGWLRENNVSYAPAAWT